MDKPEDPQGQFEKAQFDELIQRAQTLDFSRYGFAGSLTATIGGMVLVLGLAILQAFTSFKMETWGYVAITAIIAVAVVAFGILSLRNLPEIILKSGDRSLTIRASNKKPN